MFITNEKRFRLGRHINISYFTLMLNWGFYGKKHKTQWAENGKK